MRAFGWGMWCSGYGTAGSLRTGVPLDVPKPVTRALVAPATARLQQSTGILARDRDLAHSSLIPLVEGNDALRARLRITEADEHTIDLQYFLMKQDLAGALISRSLLDAADRGVRVRFLLDNIFTTVPDDALGLLDAHPNIEVRVFNPAMRTGPKALGPAAEFARVNRRMHNKTFTADGAVAIVGGRNIADEYYQIQTVSEFADFEISIIGPAVRGCVHYYRFSGFNEPRLRACGIPAAST
ncbi:MAG: phospholipase D-like domain-containing protein [Roseobacter sp.]